MVRQERGHGTALARILSGRVLRDRRRPRRGGHDEYGNSLGAYVDGTGPRGNGAYTGTPRSGGEYVGSRIPEPIIEYYEEDRNGTLVKHHTPVTMFDEIQETPSMHHNRVFAYIHQTDTSRDIHVGFSTHDAVHVLDVSLDPQGRHRTFERKIRESISLAVENHPLELTMTRGEIDVTEQGDTVRIYHGMGLNEQTMRSQAITWLRDIQVVDDFLRPQGREREGNIYYERLEDRTRMVYHFGRENWEISLPYGLPEDFVYQCWDEAFPDRDDYLGINMYDVTGYAPVLRVFDMADKHGQ